MMQRCRQRLLLCVTALVAMGILGNAAEEVQNINNKTVQVIPPSGNSSSVTELVIEGNLITLSEEDRRALASYPALEELHLDGNWVTAVPAKYFSVVPHLRVLALSRNNISSLDPEAFCGLDVLTELDLSQNLLTSLPAQTFRGLNTLQVLNLQGNPWNCSCPLLIGISEVIAANVSIGGPRVTCASPETQAGNDLLQVTAACYPSPSPTETTNTGHDKSTPVDIHQSGSSPVTLNTTLSSSHNHSINKAQPDQTPVLGNTWKFTACVAALALTTFVLILSAIKGPSWYKRCHNYRHRRLEDDEEGDVVSTVLSETGTQLGQQVFTFEPEEEDGYIEDPYIKRDE